MKRGSVARWVIGMLLFKLLDTLTRRKAAERRALARRKAELLDEMDRAAVPWPPKIAVAEPAPTFIHEQEHGPICTGCKVRDNVDHWHNGRGCRMPWSSERPA